jgi:hypothetical protein
VPDVPPPNRDPAFAALEQWRKAEQAATPGPWGIEREACECGGEWPCGHDSWAYAIRTPRSHNERRPGEPNQPYDFTHSEIPEFADEDIEFIVTARAAMPRLLAAVAVPLRLHARQEKPVRSWDLDLRCEAHDWTKGTPRSIDVVIECPACTYRERWVCSNRDCRDEDWPCAEYRALIAALLGEDNPGA